MKKRFERNATSRGFLLTERDMAIVEAVFLARYLTLSMVCKLFFTQGGASSAKRRLRILFDQRFLDKRRASPNAPDVFYLGLRGVRHMEALVGEGRFAGDFDETSVRKTRGVSGSECANPELFLAHELALSGVFVDSVLEARRQEMQLRWLPTRALELKNLGFQPDAFLDATYVDGEGKKRGKAAFVEFTQVLPKSLTTYVGERQKYLIDNLCRVNFGVSTINFLWLTTSGAKCQAILDTVSRAVARDWWHIWFVGPWEEVKDQVLTGPVWQQVGMEEKATFLTPKRGGEAETTVCDLLGGGR